MTRDEMDQQDMRRFVRGLINGLALGMAAWTVLFVFWLWCVS